MCKKLEDCVDFVYGKVPYKGLIYEPLYFKECVSCGVRRFVSKEEYKKGKASSRSH